MTINIEKRRHVEVVIECDNIEVEYAECGSHRLLVTIHTRKEYIDQFIEKYQEGDNDGVQESDTA